MHWGLLQLKKNWGEFILQMAPCVSSLRENFFLAMGPRNSNTYKISGEFKSSFGDAHLQA